MTRGAISRHIKLLEDHLGVQLFKRHARGVELTGAGRRLLPVLTEAFLRISEEAGRLSHSATDLRIICPPATSIRWLIPRLEEFRARHPDIRVRLTTDFHGDLGFDQGEYDLGFSVEHWPSRAKGVEVVPLVPVLITPACAPAILAGGKLSDPADLNRFTLLHETEARHDWNAWLAAFDVRGVDSRTGDVFPNLDMATKAAVMGAGVVMADLVLCGEELAQGMLVRPFEDMVCPGPYGGICLLGSGERWGDPKIRAFRDWLEGVAEEDRALLPHGPG